MSNKSGRETPDTQKPLVVRADPPTTGVDGAPPIAEVIAAPDGYHYQWIYDHQLERYKHSKLLPLTGKRMGGWELAPAEDVELGEARISAAGSMDSSIRNGRLIYIRINAADWALHEAEDEALCLARENTLVQGEEETYGGGGHVGGKGTTYKAGLKDLHLNR